MPEIILDLCGGTGAWSKPYRDAGYEVINITFPIWDVKCVTFYDERMVFTPTKSGPGLRIIEVPYENVHGILAAPPCTEFSKAKTTKPRNFGKGLETVKACIEIIWEVQKNSKLQFWALENPEGLLSRFLGNAPYTFEQWWFGNGHCKRTCLWGRFNPPKRILFKKPVYYERAAHNKNADWFSNSSAAKRAITPAGFAKAFFKANQ